jgi:hypothetical protein
MMATTCSEIKEWLQQAVRKGASHMIVATDTFNYEDYPLFVMPGQDAAEAVARLSELPMSKVMECYRLASPIDEQLAEHRAFHTEP